MKAGYEQLNAENLDPRINAAADKTAESFDELTSDHLYSAIKSEQLNEFTEEFRIRESQSASEKFAHILRNEVVDPNINADFEAASREFLANLDREIAANDEILWRQLQLYKLDVITQYVREKRGMGEDDRSINSIDGIVEPLDSIYSHFTSEIDGELLEPVRLLDNLDRRQAKTIYETLVKYNIREETGIEFDKFRNELESDNLIFTDVKSIETEGSV